MKLEDAEALRRATDGSRLVLLTATEAEAAPLLGAMAAAATYLVTTKKLFVGRLQQNGFSGADGTPSGTTGEDSLVATLAVGGCDKANTAHILTCLLQAMSPRIPMVIQVGVGGAFPHSISSEGARVGDIVLATKEIYTDVGSSCPAGWLSAAELKLPLACLGGDGSGDEFLLNERLVQAAASVIEDEPWPEPRPRVVTGPCVTASRVTGLQAEGEAVARRWRAVAESMEGAAAAHICALYGAPFLEVRGISNLILDRDRASWELDRAVAVAARAALAVAGALGSLPLPAADPPKRTSLAGAKPNGR